MNIKKTALISLVLIASVIFSACTTTPIDNKNKPNQMIGRVTDTDNNRISLAIISGDYAISDKTVLTITNDTLFKNGTENQFEINDYITFTITGLVLESYPTQVRANTIISIEQVLSVVVDIRETISGLFEGRFPSVVLSDFSNINKAEKDEFFVIEVDENSSTGYVWDITDTDNFEVIGSGYLPNNTTGVIGAGGKRYFGLICKTSDSYVIKLELYSPSEIITETKFMSINIK